MQSSGATPNSGASARSVTRRGFLVGGAALAATALPGRAARAATAPPDLTASAAQQPTSLKVQPRFSLLVDKKEIGLFHAIHDITTRRPAPDGRGLGAGRSGLDGPEVYLLKGAEVTKDLQDWYDAGATLRRTKGNTIPGSGGLSSPIDPSSVHTAQLTINRPDGTPLMGYNLEKAWLTDLQIETVGQKKMVVGLGIQASVVILRTFNKDGDQEPTDLSDGKFDWEKLRKENMPTSPF